jgi:hypothetical protein
MFGRNWTSIMARLTKTAITGLALSLMVAGASSAQVTLPSAGGAVLHDDASDLRALENRIHRQQYQRQQQQFREEDRLSIPLQPQRPAVPIIRPGCQTQVYGNRVVNNCR